MGVAIREGFLDSIDGEEGGVGGFFSMLDKVCIDQFLDLDIGGGDILDDVGEVLEGGLVSIRHLWIIVRCYAVDTSCKFPYRNNTA